VTSRESDSSFIDPTCRRSAARDGKGANMIILGIILLVIGLVAGIPILDTIGIILLVIGLILFLLGSFGRPVGGRRWYY
jgi:hypothetical protein